MFPSSNIQCNAQVIEINRVCEGQVEVVVKIKDDVEECIHKYYCKQVICAVPLTVLKSHKIKFTPQLPKFYTESLEKIEAGVMEKVILAF